MIAGAALLVLAAWSPFALLRLIPMMEVAAASVGKSALVHDRCCRIGGHPEPCRPICVRRSTGTRGRRPHPPNATTGGTTICPHRRTHDRLEGEWRDRPEKRTGTVGRQSGQHSGTTWTDLRHSSGGTVYPSARQPGAAPRGQPSPGSSTATEAPPPARSTASILPSRPPRTDSPPDPPDKHPPHDGDVTNEYNRRASEVSLRSTRAAGADRLAPRNTGSRHRGSSLATGVVL